MNAKITIRSATQLLRETPEPLSDHLQLLCSCAKTASCRHSCGVLTTIDRVAFQKGPRNTGISLHSSCVSSFRAFFVPEKRASFFNNLLVVLCMTFQFVDIALIASPMQRNYDFKSFFIVTPAYMIYV